MTRAGDELALRARELLGQIGELSHHIVAASQGNTGLLRIAVMPGYSWLGVLSEAIQIMARQSPGVRIAIENMLSPEQLVAIKEKKVDLGFVSWRSPLDSSLKGELVYRDPMVVAMPALVAAGKRKIGKLQQLADQQFLMFPRDRTPFYYDLLMRSFDDAGIAPSGPIVSDVPTILGLVSSGLGCGVVGASYQTRCPDNVVLRRVTGLDITLNIEMVYRADNKDPVLSNFLKVSRELLKTRFVPE